MPSIDFGKEPSSQFGEYPSIAHYVILRVVGEGGFGNVYEAEQLAPVRRIVALKVLKRGMDTDQVVRRFEAERQALAIMDHPNIAQVYDAGATEDGRPFFAMEHVAGGLPITDYCEENQLSLRERLELFVKVCHAIQHAHQKSVIHRDIKPSNTLIAMIGGEPVPKVIDFGVAKALDQDLSDATVFTLPNQMMGTPRYMSPEQAGLVNSGDIDTRSDIYSLGVLLYELLTGCHPLGSDDLSTTTLDEVRRKVREDDPRKPSTALKNLTERQRARVARARELDPKKLLGAIQGDLDSIVMMAIEKDRDLRYSSPANLALDISRFFDNQPVLAKAPSGVYVFRKFARRNKVALAVVAVIAALLVAGIAISMWFAVEARNAKIAALRGLGAQLLEANNFSGALLPWVKVLEEVDDDPELSNLNRMRIGTVLDGCPRLVGMWAHSASARSAAFGPDGTIAAAFEDGMVHLYQVGVPDPIAQVPARAGVVINDVSIGDNGRVAIACQDGLVSSFDSKAVLSAQEFSHEGKNVSSVGFGRNEQWILSASDMGSARLWDTGTLQPVAEFPHGGEGVLDADMSHDELWIATGSKDSTARIWNRRAPESFRDLQHDSWVYSVDFSRDNQRLVTASFDRTARIFDIDGTLLHVLDHPLAVRCAEFSPDSRYVVTAGFDGAVRIWSAETGREASPPMWHESYPLSASFSPEGHQVVTTTARGLIRVWDQTQTHSSFESSHAQYLSDGVTRIEVKAKSVSVIDGPSGTLIETMHLSSEFEPKEHLLNVAGRIERSDLKLVTRNENRGSFRLWRLLSGSILSPVEESAAPIAFSSDASAFAISKKVDPAPPEKPKTSEELTVYREFGLPSDPERFPGAIHMIVFNPSNSLQLAIASRFDEQESGREVNQAWLLDLASGERTLLTETVEVEKGDPLRVSYLEFSPGGKLLAITQFDDSFSAPDVLLWDTLAKERLESKVRHTDGVRHATFNFDGTILATSGEDKKTCLWRRSWEGDWDLLRVLPHRDDPLRSAFSPDGRMIATTARDGTVRVWETETGEPVTPRIKTNWGDLFLPVRFIHGQDALRVGRLTGLGSIIPLNRPDAQVEELEMMAQLIRGQEMSKAGSLLPLSTKKLKEAWEALADHASGQFTADDTKRLNWHRREASAIRDALEARPNHIPISPEEWDAALFHLELLKAANGDSGSIDTEIRRINDQKQKTRRHD